CIGLTSFAIPSEVTIIDDRLFANCEGLTSLIIPDGITSIGDNAFEYCSALSSVTFGSSVTSIGSMIFGGCESLKEINVKNPTPPTATFLTFEDVDMENCVLKVPTGCKETYMQAEYWKDFQNINEVDYAVYIRY
ncbi:MAG: leucine-rich repeat domain-containing protein, partial [Prevotella sp.]|nr:leucine-rich repeat domain-containing protein [Prevotella sp.]